MDLQTEKFITKLCEWKRDWQTEKSLDLNPHQHEYFFEWVERLGEEALGKVRTNQQLKEMIEVLNLRAREEMGIVACLSDVAIEMRWLRVLPPSSPGVL